MELKEFSEKIVDSNDGIDKMDFDTTREIIWINVSPYRKQKIELKEIRNLVESEFPNYEVIMLYTQLTLQEILDKILYSNDFEETLLELLDLNGQKSYKINMTNCGLDIDIFDIKIDSQLFKALKKSELEFYLNSKNTLNIKEMR